MYGSGEITLMVGTTIVELSDVSGGITIDAPLMEAYAGDISANSCMSGDYGSSRGRMRSAGREA